jgi:hypothetical protein
MKNTKPQPRPSARVPLREPARPLEQPEARPLSDDHPIHSLIGPAKAAETTTHQLPPTGHPPPTTQPIAPARDFVRVPNSVVRDALPARMFKGESKKTYDALYQRTRGAIVPRRQVRATLSEVEAWAGVSHNTLKAHLKHLDRVGLVRVHYVRGDNTGAEYEVFMPEEAPPTTHQPETTHPPASAQILVPPTSQILVLGGGSQAVEESITSDDSKTSSKTNTEQSDDDEAFGPLVAKLRKAVKDITGKESTAAEAARWAELADLLDAELRIAAGRTNVSSVPAFLTEHLRRRLWKKDKKQIAEEGKAEIPQSAISIDASKCPDCFGTGMYYPEGFDKGVARCRHERLKEEA